MNKNRIEEIKFVFSRDLGQKNSQLFESKTLNNFGKMVKLTDVAVLISTVYDIDQIVVVSIFVVDVW